MIGVLKKFLGIMHKIEETFLVIFVILMVIITFGKIILRMLRIGGIDWLDALVPYLVLWSAMLAAGITTSEGRHIKIDIFGRFAKGRLREVVSAATTGFAGLFSFLFCFISVKYILEVETTSVDATPILNIPGYLFLIIIPFGTFMMGLRFFVRAADYLIKAYKNIDIDESKAELEAYKFDEDKDNQEGR